MFSKESSKQVRYCIADNFLIFWFRFIYRYQSYIESQVIKNKIETKEVDIEER